MVTGRGITPISFFIVDHICKEMRKKKFDILVFCEPGPDFSLVALFV